MTNTFPSSNAGIDALRDQYRLLDLREEDIKRGVELEKQNLAAVRELKKRIGQMIFKASPTTSFNGTKTGITRPI